MRSDLCQCECASLRFSVNKAKQLYSVLSRLESITLITPPSRLPLLAGCFHVDGSQGLHPHLSFEDQRYVELIGSVS